MTERELVERDEFTAGYMIAVANILHLHDEPVIAADVLGELGKGRSALRKLDLCDYDRKAINTAFRELERRDDRRARANKDTQATQGRE